MKITVKTAGLLGKHLPAGSVRNLAQLEVPEGATPADVIKQLGMSPDEPYLVARNGTLVPSNQRRICQLAENDNLAIMPPIKGG
jgi:thiamine biosynthesis protein ThiS